MQQRSPLATTPLGRPSTERTVVWIEYKPLDIETGLYKSDSSAMKQQIIIAKCIKNSVFEICIKCKLKKSILIYEYFFKIISFLLNMQSIASI